MPVQEYFDGELRHCPSSAPPVNILRIYKTSAVPLQLFVSFPPTLMFYFACVVPVHFTAPSPPAAGASLKVMYPIMRLPQSLNQRVCSLAVVSNKL